MMLGKIKNEQIVDKIKENKFLLVETHSFVDKKTSIKHIKETYLNAERRLMLTYYKTEKDNKTQPVSISCFGNSFVRQKHDKGAGLIVSLCGSDDLTKKNVLHFFESIINSSNEEGKPWLELSHEFRFTDDYDRELLKNLKEEHLEIIKKSGFWNKVFSDDHGYDFIMQDIITYERKTDPLLDYRGDIYFSVLCPPLGKWQIYEHFYKPVKDENKAIIFNESEYMSLLDAYIKNILEVKEMVNVEFDNIEKIDKYLSQKNKDKLEEREM